MGESNDSYFEKALLKNINEDIPIYVVLSSTSEKYSVSTNRTSKSELRSKPNHPSEKYSDRSRNNSNNINNNISINKINDCISNKKISNNNIINSNTSNNNINNNIRKNNFACLFSVHNTISLSRNEQVCKHTCT